MIATKQNTEHVRTFIADFNDEWNRLQAEISAQHGARRQELEAVGRKLDGLIDAIAEGIRAPGLQQKLNELAARKAELERAVHAAPAPAPLLHPRLAEIYRQKVRSLQAALDGPDGTAALETLRSWIERVVFHPAPHGHHGFEIELVGEIAVMVALGSDGKNRSTEAARHDLFQSSIKVVAGARNHLDLLLTG